MICASDSISGLAWVGLKASLRSWRGTFACIISANGSVSESQLRTSFMR